MRFALIALAALLLAACSKDKDIEPPAELTEFSHTLKVERAWDASVGGEKDPLRLGLTLAIVGERVYAAGRDGDVAAFDVSNGKQLWRTHVKAALAGGPGAGGELVVVGTSDGHAIALNAADGSTRWKVAVGGEVLSAPAVAAAAVIVRTVDGRLRALANSDGHELWFYEQPVPKLSLRGTAQPVVVGDVVICGFDNGKVASVSVADGSLVWEATIAPSKGRTELERLVDIDSAIKVVGTEIFVVGFQGRVAMLSLDNGQVWWSRDASSYRGVALDDDAVYYSSALGELVALRKRTGAELWTQGVLKNRGLSAPAVHGDAVAVADFQGYVHWMDKATGTLVGRMATGGKRVSNPLMVSGDLLLVINDVGHITAFRASPSPGGKSSRRAPEPSPPPAATEPEAPAPDATAPPPTEAAPPPQ